MVLKAYLHQRHDGWFPGDTIDPVIEVKDEDGIYVDPDDIDSVEFGMRDSVTHQLYPGTASQIDPTTAPWNQTFPADATIWQGLIGPDQSRGMAPRKHLFQIRITEGGRTYTAGAGTITLGVPALA